MLKEILKRLARNDNLTRDELIAGFTFGMDSPNDPLFVAFLSLLTAQGISAEQLIALRKIFSKKMIAVDVKQPAIDIVGTGGDGLKTVNISTASSLLLASMGYRVLKHGNRAVSSKAGSADVLDALGISMLDNPKELIDSVEKYKFGFCFAPMFHPALKQMKDLRETLGFPTVFNSLGPLLNPGSVKTIVLGVASKKMQPIMAQALIAQGVDSALVVYSNGMDELNTLGKAEVLHVNNGVVEPMVIDPSKMGLEIGKLEDLIGYDKTYNAKRIRAVLSGKEKGTLTNTIALNTAAALWLLNAAPSIAQGVDMALKHLATGTADELIVQLQAASGVEIETENE